MRIQGRVHKYGDNIDTDVILPGKYLSLSDARELAQHCMEGVDPEFASRVKPGDIIVAGTNFGSGSSREHAPVAIKAAGVGCVIAPSFARIFFRNAVNIGLPVLETDEVAEVEAGELLEVDLEQGAIINPGKNRVYQAAPYPQAMLDIIAAGGLVEYTKKRLARP
jgi:3-isopropylmalate/(R)-2-methylmalate dehydratase small subunit